MTKILFHIDLNAFYANAEILLDPSLENTDMVVSGSSSRSVVTTATYSARKYGIHSGMSLAQALKLCPTLKVVKGHHRFYEKLSNLFIDYIKTITPLVEQVSIDECYADMSEAMLRYDKPFDLAMEIQHVLLQKYHLKCSIGIAANRFLAKMASDMKKPMGITWIHEQDVAKMIWPLPVEQMYGIGKRTAPLLKKQGIETIGDITKRENQEILRRIFGKSYLQVVNEANGQGSDVLELTSKAKSIGQSSTFAQDVVDYEEVKVLLWELAQKVSFRLIEENLVASHVTLTIRTFDFVNLVRSQNCGRYINNSRDLYEEALSLYDRFAPDKPVRLLGISVKDLKVQQQISKQLSLFESMEDA